VSLWERDAELGGKLEVAGLAPSKHEVLTFRAHQTRRLAALGVEIHTSSPVSAATVTATGPDVVIVATGAEPTVPPIPGIDGPTVHDAQLLLRGEVAVPAGCRLVVVGGSATGCETAELMCERGAEATIVEMQGSIGRGIEAITRRQITRNLRRAGVQILTRATVVGIEPGWVHWSDTDGVVHALEADLVALAIGWRPTGEAFTAGLAQGGGLPGHIEVRVLGDAESPADFVRAINAGADAGLTV
jgi:pyruvate/2-oxoglutarate dehydrogenase complex dihydrolipoamide dehydrogenase (E3) component